MSFMRNEITNMFSLWSDPSNEDLLREHYNTSFHRFFDGRQIARLLDTTFFCYGCQKDVRIGEYFHTSIHQLLTVMCNPTLYIHQGEVLLCGNSCCIYVDKEIIPSRCVPKKALKYLYIPGTSKFKLFDSYVLSVQVTLLNIPRNFYVPVTEDEIGSSIILRSLTKPFPLHQIDFTLFSLVGEKLKFDELDSLDL